MSDISLLLRAHGRVIRPRTTIISYGKAKRVELHNRAYALAERDAEKRGYAKPRGLMHLLAIRHLRSFGLYD